MHDDGRTRRYRIKLGFYRTLWALCLLLPLLSTAALCLSYVLWQENRVLHANASRLELATRDAQNTAEKLNNLRAILEQEDKSVTGPVLQNLARQSSRDLSPSAGKNADSAANTGDTADSAESGPGHADFPVVDTKLVNIDNVNARLLKSGKIRITLDLRNPEPKRNITGHVRCLFIADSGETLPLPLLQEQADFKINRFKRSVFQPPIPASVSDTTNARIILEVYTDDDTLIYRNLFPVER